MFSVHCTTHGGSVLLGPRAIERLTNTPDGTDLAWRCRCGNRGVLHLGRRNEHQHRSGAVPSAA